MDSFKFQDIGVEKANAVAKYRRIQRTKILFRFVELFVFLIVLSRFSTDQFAFSFKLSTEYFRGISVALISPRSFFVVGNAIVVVLFLISGQFSGRKGGKNTDLYDEYVEKCRNNQETWCKEEKRASDAYTHSICHEKKVLSRTHSANLETAAQGDNSCRHLRRSMSEQYRKSVDCGRKAAAGGGTAPYAEDKMSSEDFRRTVEAFIARQQRFLREEEEFSAVVSFET